MTDLNRMRIVYDNAIDDATLSATPAMVSTLPETNLQTLSRARVARTTSLATQVIKGNLTAAKVVSSLILWRHNLTATSTIRLQIYNAINQGGSEIYDSGDVSSYEYKLLGDLQWGLDPLEASVFDAWGIYWTTMWFDAVAAASFQITIKDTANPDGYMEISRAILGPYLEPSYNPEYGVQLGWDEDTKQERTAGGTLRSDSGIPYRTLKINLAALLASDRSKFLDMTRIIGLRKDFFISIYPELGGELERDHSMLAKLSDNSMQTHRFYSLHSQAYTLQET